jgi:hypothetical protein
MKIAFNRQPRRVPWGGGAHFATAFADHLSSLDHEVVHRLEPQLDCIVMLDPRHEDGGFDWRAIADYKIHNPRVKVLHRINECDARNNGVNSIDKLLIEANQIADHTVFISEWLQQYFYLENLKPANSKVIYNGCRLDWFFPSNDIKTNSLAQLERRIRLVTHHWSDNYLKGFDLYNALDKFVELYPNYEFTYIGRYNKKYTPRNIKIINPMYGEELGNELRTHDIYVTASRHEPAGMHHVEAAASGLPILYHVDGGGIVERARQHGLPFHDSNSFFNSLKTIEENYAQFTKMIDRENLSIESCCRLYTEALQSMFIL